jgi:hypothetical protein
MFHLYSHELGTATLSWKTKDKPEQTCTVTLKYSSPSALKGKFGIDVTTPFRNFEEQGANLEYDLDTPLEIMAEVKIVKIYNTDH